MSVLSLLLPLAAVTAIVLVCWLAGGTGKAVIADAETVRARLRHDEPTFAPARVLIAGDRRVALVADDSGADIVAVMAFGDKLVTRRFAHGSIRSASLREQPGRGRILTLVTDDPTCRRIDVLMKADESSESPAPPGAGGASASPAALASTDPWLAALERLRLHPARPAARPAAPPGAGNQEA